MGGASAADRRETGVRNYNRLASHSTRLVQMCLVYKLFSHRTKAFDFADADKTRVRSKMAFICVVYYVLTGSSV